MTGEVQGDFREERVFVLRTERWIARPTSQWRASQAAGMARAEVWWCERAWCSRNCSRGIRRQTAKGTPATGRRVRFASCPSVFTRAVSAGLVMQVTEMPSRWRRGAARPASR